MGWSTMNKHITLLVELPKHKVGTQFTWRKARGVSHEVTIVGYHVEHNTDTGHTDVTYRVSYPFINQTMTAVLARSTVDMAIAKQ